MATLNLLVLNSTFDEDDDPMSRDGPPNRLMQKLLRELNVIGVVMNLVQLPFTRGIELNWMTSNDSRLRRLKIVMSMCYRLMKQTVKGNERNAEELHKHVDVLRKHQGKGLSATVVLKEVYMDKRKLLAMIQRQFTDLLTEWKDPRYTDLIQPDLVRQFTDLLKEWKDPRYIDFLLNITTPEMLPRIKIVPKKAGVPNTKLLVG
ncbi:RyR and IP3R homology domain-containing protein [Baffinella frigidus]|nr:RyR and IP3R homology domain-containing protein [Cryptophyta sp. CCMP2293]